MTAIRAMQIIGTGIAQKLNVSRIGKAFKDLGFAPARCQRLRGYWVVERSAEDMRMYLKNIPEDSQP